MATLFPHRAGAEAHDRLEASIAEHVSATEAVSRAAVASQEASRADLKRGDAIADAAQERVDRQDQRRGRRHAQIEALQGVLERNQ